jgi:uncharacterized protein (TIGR03437 family)
MTHRIYSTCAVVLALALPVTILADATGTPTISSGSDFSFDNGTSSSSGGDIKFTGTSITFVGSAGGLDAGGGGTTTYNALSSSLIAEYGSEASLFTSTPISGSSLAVNEVIVVKTNGGNFAKMLITAVSSSQLKIQYDAVGSTVTGGTPTPGISSVLDAGSYTPNIAEGSVFVVRGSNLSPANQDITPSFPLPQASNGVSITFTPASGGTGTNAYILYLLNESSVNQLAAILPSTVAPGNYNVTVTNGTTSSPYNVQVVASKPGLITYDGSGNGLALIQNYVSASELDINRYTTGNVNGYSISPAKPGQTLVIYLVGLGPIPTPDNQPAPADNFLSNGATVFVYVGGVQLTPFYAGRTPGSAGLDQIDVTLPANIPTGCTVELHITENGVASQSTYLSIGPNASATACVLSGYTTSQLQGFDNGQTLTFGGFSLGQELESVPSLGSTTYGYLDGGFTEYLGSEIAGAASSIIGSTGLPTGCTVVQIPTPTPTVPVATGVGIPLDAGTVTLNGPSSSGLSNTALTETSNVYSLSFGSQFTTVPNGNLAPGTYTLNGAGGANVGKFTATLTIPALLTVTNMPTVVNRSSGLTLNWTGGNSSDFVYIEGSAENIVKGAETGAVFICYTTAGPGTFTVPSSILDQLPAVTAAAIGGSTGVGALSVGWSVGATGSNGTFSAPLVGGGTITNAYFSAGTTTAAEVPFN